VCSIQATSKNTCSVYADPNNIPIGDTAEEAARAYDRAAYAQRGATAVLNCPGEASRVAGSSSSVAPSASSRGMGRWNGERIELEYLDDKVLDDLLDKDKYGGK
jgi:hypothetical protein